MDGYDLIFYFLATGVVLTYLLACGKMAFPKTKGYWNIVWAGIKVNAILIPCLIFGAWLLLK